ncbi:MAG: hypothetical protein HQL57_04455 [Magnetococcales bacterium]|nr:hypothetical protein [Magnetococcales bacterium]
MKKVKRSAFMLVFFLCMNNECLAEIVKTEDLRIMAVQESVVWQNCYIDALADNRALLDGLGVHTTNEAIMVLSKIDAFKCYRKYYDALSQDEKDKFEADLDRQILHIIKRR